MAKKKREKNGTEPAKLTPEEFVKAWQKADDLDTFSAATGIEPVNALTRARGYVKRGVALKAYPRRSHARIDVDALNALVK